MDAANALKESLKLLSDENVPDDLRVAAFNKVFDLISEVAATNKTQLLGKAEQSTDGPNSILGDGTLERIAKRFGLGMDIIEQIYAFEAGDLELVVPSGKLEDVKARATQQIALLLVAGRQAGGIDADGWTSADVVRIWCENFKKHDSSNFSTTLKSMEDTLTIRGNGRDRKLKMTNPAYTKAIDLVRSLTTGG